MTEWIKCSERLPEKSGTYLTIDMDRPYLTMYPIRYSAKWRGWNCLDYTDDDAEAREHEMHVTHWMPLPEPPNCGAKMDGETEHGNTYSLGKIEMPKGAIEQIIADGERKGGDR